ncbi:hypothetical protein ABIF91_001060 [Bradyrhizobium sp. USDA 241]
MASVPTCSLVGPSGTQRLAGSATPRPTDARARPKRRKFSLHLNFILFNYTISSSNLMPQTDHRHMPLQFHRPAAEGIEIWSASSDGFSFVISFGSPSGPGFHGRSGYLASWRPLFENMGAIKISGSPFQTLAEAEGACRSMLECLSAIALTAQNNDQYEWRYARGPSSAGSRPTSPAWHPCRERDRSRP